MAKFSQSHRDDRLDDASLPNIMNPSQIPRRSVSVVASTWLVTDKLSSAEGLVIDGHLECAMAHHQKHLMIGEHAHVKGNISAGTVVVFGQLTGDIFSEGKVTLVSGSNVQGDIYCARLDIEEGAQFTGLIASGESAARAELEYS